MTSSTQPPQRGKGFWTPTRLTMTFIVLALVAAFGASSCNPPAEVAKTNESAPKANTNAPATNPPAPANSAAPTGPVPMPTSLMQAQLKALDGKVFKLTDFAGKVLLVNLWATWCGPCRIETPELVKLSKEYKDKGLEVIGVATKGNDPDEEQVKAFVREYQVSYKMVYADDSFAITLMQGRNSIPQSFIITRDGRLFKRFVGFSPVQTPPQLREVLEQVLNQQS
jgi:thiol-disulfide isomerase/thioredoxin